MSKLEQLIRLVEGLDSDGPNSAAVREAQGLARELEAGE